MKNRCIIDEYEYFFNISFAYRSPIEYFWTRSNYTRIPPMRYPCIREKNLENQHELSFYTKFSISQEAASCNLAS